MPTPAKVYPATLSPADVLSSSYVNEMVADIGIAGGDIDELEDRVAEAEDAIDALDTRLDAAESDITDLTNNLATTDGNLSTLTTSVGYFAASAAIGQFVGYSRFVGDTTTISYSDIYFYIYDNSLGRYNLVTIAAGSITPTSLSANTWYYVYASKTGVITYSTSSTGPGQVFVTNSVDFNYTYTNSRFLTCFRTDGSSLIVPFIHAGKKYMFIHPILEYQASTGVTSLQTVTLNNVPPMATVSVVGLNSIVVPPNDPTDTANASHLYSYYGPTGIYDFYAFALNGCIHTTIPTNNLQNGSVHRVRVLNTNGSNLCSFYTRGFDLP